MTSEQSTKKKESAPREKNEIEPSKGRERRQIERYELPAVYKDFDRMFERFRRDFEDLLWPTEKAFEKAYSLMPRFGEAFPSVDLEDRGKDFLLIAEIPGLKKENVEVEVEDNAVIIKGKEAWQEKEKSEGYLRRERGMHTFHRRIELPEAVKADDVQAKINDGLLELVLPKKSPKQRKKVQIK